MPGDLQDEARGPQHVADGALQPGLVHLAGRGEPAHQFFGRELQIGPVQGEEIEHGGQRLVGLCALLIELGALLQGAPLGRDWVELQVLL